MNYNRIKEKIILTTAAITTLVGCEFRPEPILERNMSEANGYDVLVHYMNRSKSSAEITIGDYGFSERIYALDNDGDGRVDQINLKVPKGSPLEKLASVEKIDEILRKIQEKNKERSLP
ncbi:hypothetical protein JW949_03035 [Candidatus Woesearchaeota archaeon]|nr:hypothetical protein [Candidatus Woesearchaeota archaeon]